jgi:hypothetical protein
MDNGPDLFYLLQRLQNCPEDFFRLPVLLSPPKNYAGEIYVGAIVNDLLFDLGVSEDPRKIYESFQVKHSAQNQN